MTNAFSNTILNSAKASLPTNESWFNSMNIVKDPPKSIHTKRKPKIDLVEFRKYSDDPSRIDQSISKYTKGKNLMVPVQYNNTVGGKQAYLKIPTILIDSNWKHQKIHYLYLELQ